MTKFKKGQRIGAWTLSQCLGKGGNAAVWRAMSNGEHVALKILTGHHTEQSEPFQRFQFEVGLLERLNGTLGVMPFKSAFLPPWSDVETPAWLAMPIAHKLEDQLENDSSLKVIVEAIAAYAETLAKLHEQQIYHRDIKPENLFWLDGDWIIGDFGIASFPDKPELTPMGRKFGPLFYQAPELLGGARDAAGGPADVYSLAKTLWKLGTAQSFPMPGTLHLTVPALRLSTWVGKQADLLDSVLERATLHEPGERLTMVEFEAELRAWLKPLPEKPDMESIDQYLREINLRLESDRRNQERQFIKQREFEELERRLQHEMQKIQRWYAAMGSPSGVGLGDINLMGLIAIAQEVEPIPREQILLSKTVGYMTVLKGAGVYSGVALRITNDAHLALTAAHLFSAPGHNSVREIIWSGTSRVPYGGPQQEIAVHNLLRNLIAFFPKVVDRVRRHLQDHA